MGALALNFGCVKPDKSSAIPMASVGDGGQAVTNGSPRESRLADVRTYKTFYGVADSATFQRLIPVDLSIVQPNAFNTDQIRSLQVSGKVVSYLAIGEIGDSNTYYDNGRPVLGRSIRTAHPEWFVGKNPNFDSYFANPQSPGWKAFLLQQAAFLRVRGFDGLFLDTVDTVDVFTPENKAAFKLDTPVTFDEAKLGFIDIVKSLRIENRDSVLISNRGFSILLDANNAGEGTQRQIDAVMYEVASSLFYNPDATGEVNPSDGTNPAYYWTWAGYLDKKQARGELTAAQRIAQETDNAKLDVMANSFRQTGGVVLVQDFATPTNTAVICQAYVRAKANDWVPAYADIGFRFLFDFPLSTPELKSVQGCENYDFSIQPNFLARFSPGVVNLGKDKSKTVRIKVDSVGGYTEPVAFELGAVPAGLVAQLDALTVTPGLDSSLLLSVTATGEASPGEKVLVLKATSGAHVKKYTLRVVVNAAAQSVWVTNAGNFSATVYDNPADLTADSLPNRSLADTAQFAQLYAIAVDAAGQQFLLENTSPAFHNGRLLRYGALDSSAPGQITTEGLNRPTGLALAPDGLLWVANSGLLPNGAPSGIDPNLVAYAPGASQPSRSISLDFKTYGFPKQLAVDAAGNVWVTTSFGFALGYTSVNSTAVRFATIGDAFPNAVFLNTINGLRFDAAGNLWLSGELSGAGVVLQVRAKSWSTDGTSTVLKSDNVLAQIRNGLFAPWGLALDAAQNLWVVNQTDGSGTGNGRLMRYAAATLASNPSPQLVIEQPARFALGLAIAAP